MRVLRHLRAGAGPRALLLLHGFLGSARNLATLARRLAEAAPDLSAFAFDLTGHGGSPPLPPGADLATLAADVLATARALGLAPPLPVVGHSLGGRVALRAALLAPGAVGSLVLLDVGPGPLASRDAEVLRLLDALLAAPERAPDRGAFQADFRAAGLPEAVAGWFLTNLARDAEGYRWRIDRAALAALHRRARAEDLWPAVEAPGAPRVRLIRGGRSPLVSDADARRLAAAGARVDTIPDAGHFLHVERPDEVLHRILEEWAA